jgi:hypothetical protein
VIGFKEVVFLLAMTIVVMFIGMIFEFGRAFMRVLIKILIGVWYSRKTK